MKFSIGIPAYKTVFFKECIDSVLNQEYTDFELIIVDDNSPNDIRSIVDLYDSDKIQYIRNEKNFGALHVVDNWNKCLSLAKGEFFILLGDDDRMRPNYLSEFANLIEKYPTCGVYHCRSVIIDENSEPITLTEPRPEFESVYDAILQRIMGKRHFFISDYVYRTSTLKSNGGFYKLPLAWASDDISSYIGSMQNGIAHTNEPVFEYRLNTHSISSNGSLNNKLAAIKGEEDWLTNFLQKDPHHPVDAILKENIQSEVKKFIQKKKIRTICDSNGNNPLSLVKWRLQDTGKNLSLQEFIYALILSYKERRKYRYAS
ncbi:glycosyltransferase [Dyadobacter chenwenxiniae]|uniref:Glycosyltransferase n=1 Tax=Dyadobacter chenwenxiniae TaxID=2906456 RepID=A0A9X1TE80_9BACT|nr:glycosyltransferase [Dyadobacter chenwenxiniae]MCF0062681.1 glycosyltransferase [Dyadobacter chenwenxiniae]UON83574.1 glycosyltransferase [Dyadobacter chenwenxiniae]